MIGIALLVTVVVGLWWATILLTQMSQLYSKKTGPRAASVAPEVKTTAVTSKEKWPRLKLSWLGWALAIVVAGLGLWQMVPSGLNVSINMMLISIAVLVGVIVYGGVKIYKTGGGKVSMYVTYAAIAIFCFVAIGFLSGGDAGGQRAIQGLKNIGQGAVNLVNGVGVGNAPTPGTWEVSDREYVKIPVGETRRVKLSATKRLVVEWPPKTCPAAYPPAGVEWKEFPQNWELHFLAKEGDRDVEIRTLRLGETWHGFTCN